MAEDASAENDRQRERLRRLAGARGPGEWERRLPNGWTVKTVFVHLGFWDRLSLAQLERYQRAGVARVPHDAELLNAAVAELADLLAPEQAAAWAVRCAEAVDARVRALPPALVAEIEAKDVPRRIQRHLHRREHLDQVEALLR